ncbi:MAG: hypothetical protein HYT28_03020 [Parcubacteria group bacterium]|nr:hypothetical protein [Parcubacteria group bacterium]
MSISRGVRPRRTSTMRKLYRSCKERIREHAHKKAKRILCAERKQTALLSSGFDCGMDFITAHFLSR